MICRVDFKSATGGNESRAALSPEGAARRRYVASMSFPLVSVVRPDSLATFALPVSSKTARHPFSVVFARTGSIRVANFVRGRLGPPPRE
jgi:hypothetical protein